MFAKISYSLLFTLEDFANSPPIRKFPSSKIYLIYSIHNSILFWSKQSSSRPEKIEKYNSQTYKPTQLVVSKLITIFRASALSSLGAA